MFWASTTTFAGILLYTYTVYFTRSTHTGLNMYKFSFRGFSWNFHLKLYLCCWLNCQVILPFPCIVYMYCWATGKNRIVSYFVEGGVVAIFFSKTVFNSQCVFWNPKKIFAWKRKRIFALKRKRSTKRYSYFFFIESLVA